MLRQPTPARPAAVLLGVASVLRPDQAASAFQMLQVLQQVVWPWLQLWPAQLAAGWQA